MPYLTQLDDIILAAGLTLDAEDGWQSRGHGPMDEIRTIVVHHTAGPRSGDDYPSLRTVRDGRPDLKGPLAHIGLGRRGQVHLIAAGLCWHAGRSRHIDWTNRYSIGIEVENSGLEGDDYPAVQMDALVDLCAALVEAFGLDVEDVRGHKEICDPPGRKVDPSFGMPGLRTKVRTRIQDKRAGRSSDGRTLKAPRWPLPSGHYFGPKSGPVESVSGYYSHGDDLKRWQTQMAKRGWKLKASGVYDDATAQVARAFRREKKMGDSAAIGPRLWAAAWEAPVT